MRRTNETAIEAVDRALGDRTLGQRTGPSGRSTTDTMSDPFRETVRRLRAAADTATPDGTFARQLREELMTQAESATAGRHAFPSPIAVPNHRADRPRSVPPAPPRATPAVRARRRPTRLALERAGSVVLAAALVIGLVGSLLQVLGSRQADQPAPAATGGSAMEGGNAARTGEWPGPGPVGKPGLRWRVPNSSLGSFRTRIYPVQDMIYTIGESANSTAFAFDIVAFDAYDGSVRWQASLPGPILGGLAIEDGLVFVATESERETLPPDEQDETASAEEPWLDFPVRLGLAGLVAFDRFSGDVRWRVTTEFSADVSHSITPSVSQGLVILRSPTGSMTAFEAGTGGEVWTLAARPIPADQSAGGNGLGPIDPLRGPNGVAISGGTIYAANLSGGLTAVDLLSGRVIWETANDQSSVTLAPVVAGGRAYVVLRGRAVEEGPPGPARLVAVDISTGEDIWGRDFSPWEFHDQPLDVTGNTLLVPFGTAQGTIVLALDAASGVEVWRSDPVAIGFGNLSVRSGVVYTHSRGGELIAIDVSAATGCGPLGWGRTGEWTR
ncbi:MAG: PQQ-like beta-propeller repeat protein [Chloroflexota bacterium]|nr:PQQ-like beta-propeller repeat protein [Chloroflexota bacterium]